MTYLDDKKPPASCTRDRKNYPLVYQFLQKQLAFKKANLDSQDAVSLMKLLRAKLAREPVP